MKKFTLFAAMAVVALGASAQFEVDPGLQQVLDKGGKYTVHALVLDQGSIDKLEAAGSTVIKTGMINDETTHWYWWCGWTTTDASYPGVDFQTDGYIAQAVSDEAPGAGWSGGGLYIQSEAGWDTSAFCEETRLHMAYRSMNPADAIGVVLLNEDNVGATANITVGKSAFVDNGKSFPIVGDFDREGGDWKGVDISFADLKKLCPDFQWANKTAWPGNAFAVLSGNVAGKDFAFDAIYFYTPKSEDGVSAIEADNNAAKVYYNLQGQVVANPANGLYICLQGGKTQKVLVK